MKNCQQTFRIPIATLPPTHKQTTKQKQNHSRSTCRKSHIVVVRPISFALCPQNHRVCVCVCIYLTATTSTANDWRVLIRAGFFDAICGVKTLPARQWRTLSSKCVLCASQLGVNSISDCVRVRVRDFMCTISTLLTHQQRSAAATTPSASATTSNAINSDRHTNSPSSLPACTWADVFFRVNACHLFVL